MGEGEEPLKSIMFNVKCIKLTTAQPFLKFGLTLIVKAVCDRPPHPNLAAVRSLPQGEGVPMQHPKFKR